MWFSAVPARAVAPRRAAPAGRHLEPLPPSRAEARSAAGTRTTSPRTPTSASASAGPGYRDGGPRLDHLRGGQQRLRQLDQAALALVQGLPPDLAGPHARTAAGCGASSGLAAFIGFNLFVGGTPIVAIINPIFWAMTAVWFLAHPDFIHQLFPAWLYYLGLACFVASATCCSCTARWSAARSTGNPDVVLAALLSPIYWADDVDRRVQGGHPARLRAIPLGEDDARSRPRAAASRRVHGPTS